MGNVSVNGYPVLDIQAISIKARSPEVSSFLLTVQISNGGFCRVLFVHVFVFWFLETGFLCVALKPVLELTL